MLGAFAISTIGFGVSEVQPPECPFSSTPIAVAVLVLLRPLSRQSGGLPAASRSTASERQEPSEVERAVAVHTGPVSFAGSGDVDRLKNDPPRRDWGKRP
jgi:hypothetical protein